MYCAARVIDNTFQQLSDYLLSWEGTTCPEPRGLLADVVSPSHKIGSCSWTHAYGANRDLPRPQGVWPAFSVHPCLSSNEENHVD